MRTAVFNYLFAKKHGGKFILRIEDTDRERSKKEYEQNIIDTLEWLDFKHDAFYRQSDHTERYSQAMSEMLAKDLIYISKETPTEEGQRSEVVRFRNPNKPLSFTDVIRGTITIDTTDLGDFIIGRSITEPLYHFGVVVDDFDEGVTHVIRGEDHIPNTPRQLLILEALGGTAPIYAHLPLVLGTDKTKLSKRKGAKAITQYRDEGFLPEAMINYLALLGWHPEGEQEIFTLDELVAAFTLERIQKSAGVFDEVKLRWFNHEHLKQLSNEVFMAGLITHAKEETLPTYTESIISLLRERSQTFGDAVEALRNGEFSFLSGEVACTSELVLQGAKAEAPAVKENLQKVAELLQPLTAGDFTAESTKEIIFPYATEVGRASVLWPLRVALSGKEKSPDPFTLMGLVGKEKTLERIAKATEVL